MKDVTQDHQPTPRSPAARHEASEGGGELSARLAQSPRQLAQRRRLDETVGAPAQRVEDPLEEDEDGAAQLRAEPVQRQENRTGMPDNLKTGLESLSGMDMSDVRVHRNSSQPAQLNALAYAQGNDIHLGPGQEQHLPHEAWHVVQQAQGRVQPTMQMNGGVPVNDDRALELEADEMGTKALSPGITDVAQRVHRPLATHAKLAANRPPAQRRLADPTDLDRASAAVVNGARSALVETALDIYRSGVEGQTYVTRTLGLRTTRSDMTDDVADLNVDNLGQMIRKIRTERPDQAFNSTNFDVRPTMGTQGSTYVNNLVIATLSKMQNAANSDITLRSVFGDGDPSSGVSQTAAGTARGKILAARTRLNGFRNIYIDSSGISERVGVGGYANFNRKIFLLVADINAGPSNAAVSTLFHESMHLAHAEILDDGGYSNTGTRFSGALIAEKLTNADHYAEVAKVLDGETTHVLPFTPETRGGGGTPARLTNPSDTADTMAVRHNVMHRCRQLWSGAADGFMSAVRDSRDDSDWWNRKSTSTKLNMTYHNKASLFDTPALNETDLSLAEGTMNRISRFTNALTAKMNSAANDVFTTIRDAYTNAAGTGDSKQAQAGKNLLVAEGTASAILAPQDKTPSVAERFDSISR